jgi:ABC-type amino acid transport substrate-binding protein
MKALLVNVLLSCLLGLSISCPLTAQAPAQSTAQKTMKIAVMDIPDHILIRRIIEKAYKQLDIKVEFVELPGKRALAESSSGHLDGELSRIYDVGMEYPSLIRVPTPMFWFTPVAYSHLDKLDLKGPDALKKYRIGIMIGMYYTEQAANEFGQVTLIDDLQRLYQLLNRGRIDIVLDSDINGRYYMKKKGYKNVHPITPKLSRINAYHYVHEKHKALVPKLDKVFTAMKKSGELDKMRQDFLAEIARP